MPIHVAASPVAAATAIALAGLFDTRSAVAAGPISSAVDNIAPMATADSDTEMASAIRYAAPTRRTLTPRALATSGDSEVSSSTRARTTTVSIASTPEATSAGTVSPLTTKMEPNKIVKDAPVVDV